MKKITLPQFQEYLRTKSLLKEKYIPFYANWANKFLAFSKNEGNLSHDIQIQKFLDLLKGQENIADWQIKQADNAIRNLGQRIRKLRKQAGITQEELGERTVRLPSRPFSKVSLFYL